MHCVYSMALASAFEQGDKEAAEHLLPHAKNIATIRTLLFITRYPFFFDHVSLVHLAAYHGWLDVIDNLITRYGCNVHCTDPDGHSSLHCAAIKGHLEVVKYLISKYNFDPLCVNKDDVTPLHYACTNGHLNIIQYLISEVHCNPSCKDKNGDIPLHYACRFGHFNIVQYLVSELHCNPSCENHDGNTPLHYACSKDIAQYLISKAHCNPSHQNDSGSIPLHHACSEGHFDVVQYLIGEACCNPSCVDNEANAPLHYASRVSYVNRSIVMTSWVPLTYVCVYSHYEVIQYLLFTGRVDPLAENKDGNTPLYCASRCDDSYKVLKLFKRFIQCRRNFPVHMLRTDMRLGPF